MVLKLLHVDVVAADEQYALDIKRGLLAEHAELSKRILLETLKSLEEPFEQILEFVAYLALFADFVIMKEPEGPSFAINLLEHLLVADASLIWAIHKESLEVIDSEVGRRESIEGIPRLFLFLGGFGLRHCSAFGGLGASLGRFLFHLEDWLKGLFGHLDHSKDRDEFWQSDHSLEPSTDFWSSLREPLIKVDLEYNIEGTGKEDISDCDRITYKPVSFQALIDDHERGFD